MKHLAKINNEFAKKALNKQGADWDSLSYEAQKQYLGQHPASKRRLTAQPGQGGADLHELIDEKREGLGGQEVESTGGQFEIMKTMNKDNFDEMAASIADNLSQYLDDDMEPDEVIDEHFGHGDHDDGMMGQDGLELDHSNLEQRQWVTDNQDWIANAVSKKLWDMN